MSQRNNKTNLDFKKLFKKVFWLCLIFYTILFVKWIVFDIYKPQEKIFIAKSKKAYLLLQEELNDYYLKKGYIFESTDAMSDDFCSTIKKKYGTPSGDCNVEKRSIEKENIEFKKGKITLHGFSNPPYSLYGTLVKDIFIDVNGQKGENTFGIDRVPVRIYSSGKLGGMISPINCKKEDSEKYDVPYSVICPPDININFLDSNKPFAFNVMQIGAKKGRTRILNKKVSYLRADCVAFGGEMISAIDYCDHKRYQWLTACYHEFRCAIGLGRKDKIRPKTQYIGKDNK